MFHGDKQKTAEYFLTQLHNFANGVRLWKWEAAVHNPEIHAAVLFLCEDAAFVEALRHRWSEIRAVRDNSNIDALIDSAPSLVDGFFEALLEYLERDKGKLE